MSDFIKQIFESNPRKCEENSDEHKLMEDVTLREYQFQKNLNNEQALELQALLDGYHKLINLKEEEAFTHGFKTGYRFINSLK